MFYACFTYVELHQMKEIAQFYTYEFVYISVISQFSSVVFCWHFLHLFVSILESGLY